MSRMFDLMRHAQRDVALLQRSVAATAATNSRNFELLQRAQRDQLLFESTKSPMIVSSEPAGSQTGSYSGGESFKLVQRLFLSDRALAPRVVVFCAVEQPSEQSWTCAQAADLLAHHTHGSSVCVIDANLARPSLHAHFDVENQEGLAEAILGTRPVVEFTRTIDRGCLRLMSAGMLSPGTDAREVLRSGRLTARVYELRASFDYILIDAPPAAPDSLTIHLAALVDGFILIVEPNFTPKQAARLAKDHIEAAGGRVLGVVLHRRGLPFRPRAALRHKSLLLAQNS
jgi:Mrp family chromosome partitioning ATPase